MKITLEMITYDLARMYPMIVRSTPYKALAMLGKLQTTKNIGIDMDGLQKDYAQECSIVWEPEKPTAQEIEIPAKQCSPANEPVETKPAAEQNKATSNPDSSLVFGERQELPEFLRKALNEVK